MQQLDINFLINLSIQAGNAIMHVYNDPNFHHKFEIKSDNSPLTEADIKSNQIITKGLTEKYPTIPIISEEGKSLDYAERSNWKKFWLVDPLDGTKEFIKRNGEFTVNIALIEEGIPTFGIIYVPVKEDVYLGYNSICQKISKDTDAKDIKVSKRDNNLTAIGSRTHSSKEDEEYLSQFSISNYISAGSSLKFCLLAEGMADIYYRSGPTMEWDTAAGHAIVLAAGGTVENLSYNKPSLLNGPFICKGF
ncbi:MAG: 3'(2'),5'-bisphosphate nucleotidase CysQ [Cytophagales bacterium]|nr:3'(2'),5'-bisphosphate nucleotidase CysQ [Cytophagales bacterium]